MEIDWRVPLLRQGAYALTLIGSHAELRGEVLDAASGQYGDVRDMPPRITNLGLDWTHKPSLWSLGLSFNYQPAYTTLALNDNDERERKRRNASYLLDLYVGKVFSPTAELRLVAKNVLALKKREATIRFNANGDFVTAESRLEESEPTVYLTYEARF